METIFVGNLSYFCTNKSLFDLFSTVGPVQAAMVRKSRRNQPLHYGFVEMIEKDAIQALEVMNNRDFMGRKLRVALRRGISDDMAPQLHFHSIHLSFVTSDTDALIDEGFLIHAFSHFGGLEDCVIKQHVLSKRRQKQGGYAFLYFKDQQAAENVIAEVKRENGKLGNILYDAKLSCTNPNGPRGSADAYSFDVSPAELANNLSVQNHPAAMQNPSTPSVNPKFLNHHQQYYPNHYHPTTSSVSASLDTVVDSSAQPTLINTSLSDSSFSTPSSSFYYQHRSPSTYHLQHNQLAKQQAVTNPSTSPSTSGKSMNNTSNPNSGVLTPINSFHNISTSSSVGITSRQQFSHSYSNSSNNSNNNIAVASSCPDSHHASPQTANHNNHLNSPHMMAHPSFQQQNHNPSVQSVVHSQYQTNQQLHSNNPVYVAPSFSSPVALNNSTVAIQSLTLPPTSASATQSMYAATPMPHTGTNTTHPRNCGCNLCFPHSSKCQINPLPYSSQTTDSNQTSPQSSVSYTAFPSQQQQQSAVVSPSGDFNANNYPTAGHMHAIPSPPYYYYHQPITSYPHPSLFSSASCIPQTGAPIIYYSIPQSMPSLPSPSVPIQDVQNNNNHQVPAPQQGLSIGSMPSMASYYPQPYSTMSFPAASVTEQQQQQQHFSTSNNNIHSTQKSIQNNDGHHSGVPRSHSGTAHSSVTRWQSD